MWNLDRIQQLIRDSVEESLSIEYKSAGALGKSDTKKTEITKDVSAFANSTGGVLIYGIAEFQDAISVTVQRRLILLTARNTRKSGWNKSFNPFSPESTGS